MIINKKFNYNMKSIEYHYTNLVHTIQRNLYHTDAPLAKQSSMSLGQISEALIHRNNCHKNLCKYTKCHKNP